MPVVYSTLTASQEYSLFEEGGADMKIRKSICLIKGGSGVANAHFITPRGVPTQVTHKELELLNQCPMYIRHKERGFIREEKEEVRVEKVVASMTKEDGSAPLTDEKLLKQGKKAAAAAAAKKDNE